MPAVDTLPTVGALRGGARLAALAVVVLTALVLAPALPLLPTPARHRVQRRWCRAVLAALEIRCELHGAVTFAPPGVPVLVVGNHVSWLDVIALNAVQVLRMVTRSDVRHWPVLGWVVSLAGALYIDRDRLSSLPRAVAAVTAALRGGAAVGAFPEGTTWCGRRTGRFRPAVFQAAVESRAEVRPVAVGYRLAGTGAATTAAAFVGDATLWDSLTLVARVRGLVVRLEVLAPLGPPDGDAPAVRQPRRELAAAAASAVGAAVGGVAR